MIIADHVVPEKFCDTRERIAKNGAPNMANMHRLSDIGRSEINHDAPRRFCLRDSEPFIAQNADGFFSNRAWTQRKIDETGTCDRWQFAKIVNTEMLNDFLRNIPRIFAPLLSEHQSGIRLVIAESRVGCRR